MRYYVISDVHGFRSIMTDALDKAGYFADEEPHKLVMLGDLFDRGHEAKAMQDFVVGLMEKEQVILVRGNHEDLFTSLVTEDGGLPYRHHVLNGTYETALQLTGLDIFTAQINNQAFAARARETPFYQRIIPAMVDFFETAHYVFTHGWIPCVLEQGHYCYVSDWRNSPAGEWDKARWVNGIDAAQTCNEKKTVVCGHWHASYGHFRYEHKGSEFGEDAVFSPYYGPGVIAVDACTAYSKTVNVVVIDDEEKEERQ